MKKYLFIIGLIGTALFTACSSADDLVADIPSQGLTEEEKAMILEAGKDSDVPITLGSVGSNRAITRKPIDSDGNKLFDITGTDGQYLGVFCLARGKQVDAPNIIGSIPATDSGIQWGKTAYARWLDNTPAKVVKKAAAGTIPAYSDVVFMNDGMTDEQIRYYPFGNWYYYNFYAYYPRVSAASPKNPRQYVDLIVADYTITGKEDIIYSKAIATAEEYVDYDPDNNTETNNSIRVNAYSSKYFRLKNKDKSDLEKFNNLPEFTFSHKLTQLFFQIKAASVDDAKNLNTRNIKLKRLTIKDCYNKLGLVVASKRDGLTDGDLLLYNTGSSGRGDVNVWTNVDGDPFASSLAIVTSNSDVSPKDIGYAMVPPSAVISGNGEYSKYKIHLEMEPEGVPSTDIVLDNTFEAGKKYTITIDVYAPEEIHAKATLTGWSDQTIDPIPVY